MLVRPIRPEDRAAWEPLWQGYQTFYKVSLPAEVTDETWRRLHDPTEPVHGLVAELDGRVVGLAHFVFHKMTWTIADRCYLNDLFADESARGRGVGRALTEAVYAAAKARGITTVWWLTHETNEAARALYDRIARRSGFIQYRHDS